MNLPKRQVELLEKNKPRQERAKRTYEAILESAAELLVEVGIERISTNLIAERAGITVPALYRYFPNKYAVINALGAVVMDKQNRVFRQWYEDHLPDPELQQMLDNIDALLLATYNVTLEQTGGVEIIQSLRAVGPLQALRLGSHRSVAAQFAGIFAQVLDVELSDELSLRTRVTTDIGYAFVELALEDTSLPAERTLREGADMIRSYWESYLREALPPAS